VKGPYETGWLVSPAFQGQGVATSATEQVIERVRTEAKLRYLEAYPSVDNAASNTICRKLGFALVGILEYEYPGRAATSSTATPGVSTCSRTTERCERRCAGPPSRGFSPCAGTRGSASRP
jgi:hypothetical protein